MTKTHSGFGRLVVFALPFAAGGLLVRFMMVKMAQVWLEVRHWQEVPAGIFQAEIASHQHSDSTTHELIARYESESASATRIGPRIEPSESSRAFGCSRISRLIR